MTPGGVYNRISVISRLEMAAIVLLAPAGAWGAPAEPTPEPVRVELDAALFPVDVVGAEASEAVVTIEAGLPIANATLGFQAPPGFSVRPTAVRLPPFTGRFVQHAIVAREDGAPSDGSRPLIVRLALLDGGRETIAASRVLTFWYTAQISTAAYVTLGGIGIALGYLLRLLVKLLGVVPRPAPVLAAPPPEGPIGRFVRTHYYIVDFLVTLTIGFLALAALMQGARPPQTAAAWPQALTLGVSLGLLTNSELLTKLR